MRHSETLRNPLLEQLISCCRFGVVFNWKKEGCEPIDVMAQEVKRVPQTNYR